MAGRRRRQAPPGHGSKATRKRAERRARARMREQHGGVEFPDDLPIAPSKVSTRIGQPCAYCGERSGTLDHVIPRAHGGADIAINRVACCQPCNNAKADIMLRGVEFEWNPVALFPSRIDWRMAREHVALLRKKATR